MNNKLYHSIEFLRGLLATTVAVCHLYLSKENNIHLEAISSLCVEVFFIISGFVLAPQLIKLFETRKIENFKIFIFRRFLRTLPVYIFYLIIISLLLNKFLSIDFFKYLFFIQNFFSINVELDYFSIAWSLSVEEWFYVIFTIFLLFLKRSFLVKNIKICLLIWFFIFFLLKIFYFSFNDFDFGTSLRRITIFRLDTIALGSIFFIYKDLILENIKKYNIIVFFLPIPLYFIFISGFRISDIISIQILLLFTHLFSIAVLYNFILFDDFFKHIYKISIFFGKISYSIYLSHLILIILFDKLFQDISIFILGIYLILLFFISLLSRKYIEEIFLNLRPKFNF